MRQYMLEIGESWLSQVEPFVKSIVQKYFSEIHHCYERADVLAKIDDGQALRKLKNEVTEHLSILANIN